MRAASLRPSIPYLNGTFAEIRHFAAVGELPAYVIGRGMEAISSLKRQDQFDPQPGHAESLAQIRKCLPFSSDQLAPGDWCGMIALDMVYRTIKTQSDQDESWHEIIGQAIFDALRWKSHLMNIHAPRRTQPAPIIFMMSIHPHTERILSIRKAQVHLDLPERAVAIRFTYTPQDHTIHVLNKGADRYLLDMYGEQEVIQSLNPAVYQMIRNIDKERIVFPQLEIPSKRWQWFRLNAEISELNFQYMEKVLLDIIYKLCEEVPAIRWQEILKHYYVDPQISVSVAPNGLFVGVLHKQPKDDYEWVLGMPALGTLARVHYEVYRNHTHTLHVPTGFRWNAKPNRWQKSAVKKWQDDCTEKMNSETGWIKAMEQNLPFRK